MWWVSLALAAPCAQESVASLAKVEAPAVFVVAERRGVGVDQARALHLVDRLRRTQPVRVAFTEVMADYQPVLDRFAGGQFDAADLHDLVRWDAESVMPWGAYRELVGSAVIGVEAVAAGHEYGPAPQDAVIRTSPGYLSTLRPAMHGEDVALAFQERFVRAMAWYDTQVAESALLDWDGEGYLVLIAPRLHVEGGKGIPWQMSRRTEAPVHTVVLSPAGAACRPGDLVLKGSLLTGE